MTRPRWEKEIFVFGSNLNGRHGKGAAEVAAALHGAVEGVGRGLTGNAYALPTKGHRASRDQPFPILGLGQIRANIQDLICCATAHRVYRFNVTAIGCGLAGYQPAQVAPAFELADDLDNLYLPETFVKCLPNWPPHQISFDEAGNPVADTSSSSPATRTRGYHRRKDL